MLLLFYAHIKKLLQNICCYKSQLPTSIRFGSIPDYFHIYFMSFQPQSGPELHNSRAAIYD